VRERFGAGGLLVSGFVVGLADVDAITVSMAKTAASGAPVTEAAAAVVLGAIFLWQALRLWRIGTSPEASTTGAIRLYSLGRKFAEHLIAIGVVQPVPMTVNSPAILTP